MESVDDIYHPTIKPPKVFNVVPQEWVLNVRVIEARDLAGVNLDPFVVVTVDSDLDTQRQTKIVKQTCNPEWDEIFVFNQVG